MSAVLTAREPSARYLMQQHPLVQHFEPIATAPGGVSRLRELILTLAVQGKLVQQDPNDEPASELLKKIRAEKDRLISEGKIKRDKPLEEIQDEEKPFALPKGWTFCRLGALLLSIRSGGTPSKQNPDFWGGSIPWASVKDLSFGEPISDTQDRITQAGLDAGSELAPAGSILICTRMGLGKIGEALIDVAINQDLKAVLLGAGVNKHYFIKYFKTLAVVGSGMTVAGIKQDDLLGFIVPLPPIEEQSRIVTRVEELMRLCDVLEANGQLEAKQHTQLVSALLGTLTDSETPEQLADNWQRIAALFDLLLDRPEAVDALEQAILQLAVRGLLVPQDPQDEPASELLKKIRVEKDKLMAEGKIKRDKPLPPIAEGEKQFALPPGWGWARLPDLCAISSGATPSKAIPQNWEGSIPWVSPKDMKVPHIADAQDHVSEAAVRGSLSLIPTGSLLMVVRGMILAHSFPVAETLVPVTINQDMKALTPFEPRTLSFISFLCRGLKPEILALVDRSSHGTCKLESPKIFGKLLPIPPLAEQSRIVTRVAQLRRLCADLRQRLAASRSTQAQLADALIGELA